MGSQYAISLDNWWVEPSRLITRKGNEVWADGFEEPVETLFEYRALDGSRQMFAASGENIYDTTKSGPIGDPVITGQTSARYSVVNASTPATPPAGAFIYLFNGSDDALLYDGQEWKQINEESTPSIKGVDTKDLVNGLVFKGRLYIVQKQSLIVWYLPPTQIGGDAQKFDLSSVFQRGGHIIGIYSWTMDAGTGPDDYFVALSSEGEAVIYQGYDPGQLGGFSLVGLYYIGRPIGLRPTAKWGGDLLVLCEQGLIPISAARLGPEISESQSRTYFIQNSLSQAMRDAVSDFGFEICPYPAQNALILNIPRSQRTDAHQYVQNTITGAWTKFTGWKANTFLNTKSGLFFGDKNSVRRAWVAETDNGEGIVSEALQSFSGFGSPGHNKYFTLVRPYMRANGAPSVLFSLNGDFSPESVSGSLSYQPPTGAIWGRAVWGREIWGGQYRQLGYQNVVGKIYRTAGLRIKVLNNSSSVEWSATDINYTVGNQL